MLEIPKMNSSYSATGAAVSYGFILDPHRCVAAVSKARGAVVSYVAIA